MNSIQTYFHRGRQMVCRAWADQRFHRLLQVAGYFFTGFFLSAASLGNFLQPIAMGFVWACSGVSALPAAVGSMLGYACFWPGTALQGVVWIGLALFGKLFTKEVPSEGVGQLLLPAMAALMVAASGVGFQILAADDTPVTIYLIRVLLAAGTSWLFTRVLEGRSPVLEWVAGGLCVLALAQIMPIPCLNLGILAAGALTVAYTFPAAALAGLALDLAQITPVPMTAVMVLAFLARFLPRCPRLVLRLAPAAVYIGVMSLRGSLDLQPLLALVLGGILGSLLPGPARVNHRRGETGVAQVRLEIAAGVFSQVRQILLEMPPVPVDEDALICRAAERACGSCPARSSCKDSRRLQQLPGLLLHKPLLHPEELPVMCRKSGRFLAELHRSQEQLRSIRADRERQQEYREALTQQYGFLTDFLQDLADRLSTRPQNLQPYYKPQVQSFGNRPRQDNGDRVIQFAGTMCRYYIVLCDGMGTGIGAVHEGQMAAAMLRRMLTAGFPAEYALRSLNSLCALRDRAGAVTVDMAEVELYTGKVSLYKWGAAPSWLVWTSGVEKLGTASPPPGLSVEADREQVQTFSLRRNQTLIMVSDGVDEEAARRCCQNHADRSPGELARSILTCSQVQGQDDATVVTVRLTLAEESYQNERQKE